MEIEQHESLSILGRQRLYSEVLKKIADTPASGPAAQEYLRERQRITDRNVRGGIRLIGLVVSAAGIGLMIFLSAVTDGPPREVGMIPLLVGLALLIDGQFLAPRA